MCPHFVRMFQTITCAFSFYVSPTVSGGGPQFQNTFGVLELLGEAFQVGFRRKFPTASLRLKGKRQMSIVFLHVCC